MGVVSRPREHPIAEWASHSHESECTTKVPDNHVIAVLTGKAEPCRTPKDVNTYRVVVVGLIAIHDELSSVVTQGAGDRRVSSKRVVSLRVGINPKCENRPQIVWGVKGLSVKVCRV